MSENSLPPAPPTIKHWLSSATTILLAKNISSARLDCIILLEDELQKDRSWLLAHDETELQTEQLERLNQKVVQRTKHIPLAYIRGFVEFYGRRFIVNSDVLIPRPETEDLIEIALNLNIPANSSVIDVGTGSGCIGITLALERPGWQVALTDISPAALDVARQNVGQLHADATLHKSDLLSTFNSPLGTSCHLVTANLPYVAEGFEISPDAHAEPGLALYASNEGYQLIEALVPQTATILQPGGFLLLESDPWQQERIIETAVKHGFTLAEQRRFHVALKKRLRAF